MAKSLGGASKAKGKKTLSGAHSRAQGDGTIGLMLLDGPPDAPESEGPHAALLDGNPHVHFDGEYAWGWKRYPGNRYVFAWLDGGDLRESRFESDNPGEHAARKADGSAYLVTVGPRAVWEVRADTGKATLVTELDHVSALAYFGERHAWVCGSSAVLTFGRKGDRLELESRAKDREFVGAIVTVLGDRVAVLGIGVGASAYVVVSTDAGPVVGEKFKFGFAAIQGWKGRALALNGEATGGAWEFTHLEEALAQAQAGKGKRFEFPRRPKDADEGGGDEAPATYEREAAEGHVGLRLVSTSMSLPFARDPAADDAAEALVDSADTKSAEGLVFGWRRERKRKFRYVWAEGGVARQSDVVSDGDPSAHKVGFDRRRFLVVTGGNESKLWAIDRATGRGSLVFYDPDETVMTATDAAPDRVVLATMASVSIRVPKDGGWAFEQSGGLVARGMATGANGRIVAFGGEEQGLTVWAVTSRGVVQVDTLDVEGILSIAEHEQRLVVQAGQKLVSYELTNLAAVVDAAERDTGGERYPAVDLEASIREAMAAMDEAGEPGDEERESPEGE